MQRSYTPDTPRTARPIYATGPMPSHYDDMPTPRASDYTPQALRELQLQERAAKWTTLPSITIRSELSALAPELRPSSALSGRVSRSSTSSSMSVRSHTTAWSSDTSATSVSRGSADTKPVAAMGPPRQSIPVFPHSEPGENAYRAYRERLRCEPDVTTPIKALLETGVSSYDLTQHIAILASRLSVHAACGPVEFKARMRAEAMGMFQSYWSVTGAWRSEVPVPSQYLVSPGVNLAAFLGSMFRYELIGTADMHACFDALLSATPSFLKLQAAHAATVHCGARISDDGLDGALRTCLSARGPDGRLLWGSCDLSYALMKDLLDTLYRWAASREMVQIHARAAALSPPSATERSRRPSPQPRLP